MSGNQDRCDDCKEHSLVKHRLEKIESKHDKLETELKDIQVSTNQCLSIADKVYALAKMVKEIKNARDVWKDRIIWLIILLIITSLYNYGPKFFSQPQHEDKKIVEKQTPVKKAVKTQDVDEEK